MEIAAVSRLATTAHIYSQFVVSNEGRASFLLDQIQMGDYQICIPQIWHWGVWKYCKANNEIKIAYRS